MLQHLTTVFAEELPYLSRLNRHILLLSYSLHFPGRVQPILEECRQTAFKAAQYVQEWLAADYGLVYASNFTVRRIRVGLNSGDTHMRFL